MADLSRRDLVKMLVGAVVAAAIPGCGGSSCEGLSCGNQDPTLEFQTDVHLKTPKERIKFATDYLIITDENLSGVADELVDFRKEDHSVEKIPISEISKTPTDIAIRDFLVEYVQSRPNLKYIVLVGDSKAIPTSHFYLGNMKIPTDFFYSNIKSEGQLPDLSIGRIPSDNTTDLGTIIRKIKLFEGRRIEEVSLFGYGTELEMYGLKHKDFLASQGYSTKLIEKASNQEDDLQNVVNHINQGPDILMYYGHGDTFKMYPFEGTLLPELDNSPFILISGGCDNNNFTNEEQDLCMGYSFLKNENGSVASIGSTRRGGFGHKYLFIDGFFERESGEYTLGELMVNGMKRQLNQSIKNGGDIEPTEAFIKRFCLLGDPALKIHLSH